MQKKGKGKVRKKAQDARGNPSAESLTKFGFYDKFKSTFKYVFQSVFKLNKIEEK